MAYRPSSVVPWAVALLLAGLLLAGCLVQPQPDVIGPTPTPSAPPLPPVGGRIAFLSDRTEGRRELWIVNSDGSAETRLLPGRLQDGAPVWAPGGQRLAYVGDVGGKAQIGVLLLNADNTPGQSALLTADAQGSDNTNPAWSPDGRRIAFQSNRTGGPQIFVMPSVGGPATALSNQPPFAIAPIWAPDGQTLVFAGGVDALHTQLYSVPAAGGMPAPLTNVDRPAVNPVWMPDGKALLFLLTTAAGRHTIATIRPDGSGEHDLTTAPSGANAPPTAPPGSRPTSCPPEDLAPQPAPDSGWIAFFSVRACNEDVFVVAADGTGLANLTADDPADDLNPSWAPDSSRLAFASNREGRYRLYVLPRTGGTPAPLTAGSGDYDDVFPTWSAR